MATCFSKGAQHVPQALPAHRWQPFTVRLEYAAALAAARRRRSLAEPPGLGSSGIRARSTTGGKASSAAWYPGASVNHGTPAGGKPSLASPEATGWITTTLRFWRGMTELNGVNFSAFTTEASMGRGGYSPLRHSRRRSIVPRKGPKFRLGKKGYRLAAEDFLQAAADPPSTTPSGRRWHPPLELQA